jgi:ketosteroid isomerase-like protein
MSKDGLEIVKRGIAAYNAGDMDAMMHTYAPDVEAFPDASAFPDAHRCHGRAEFRAWLEESATAWAKPSWVVTEVPAVDGEQVLVRGDWGGHGTSSGLPAAASITGIFAVRDAQISRVEFFLDHQKALSALGLAG